MNNIEQEIIGTWVDRCTFADGTQILGIVEFCRDARTKRLIYRGRNLGTNGSVIGSFSSELSNTAWPVMTFKYKNSEDSKEFHAGTQDIQFQCDAEGRPVRFISEVRDDRHQQPIGVEGIRITAEAASSLETVQQAQLNSLIVKYLKES